MACGFSINDVIRYKDIELPQKKRRAFEEHLDGCEKCRALLMRLSQIESEAGETLAPDYDISSAAISLIKREGIKSGNRKRSHCMPGLWRVIAPALSVALFAALLVLFWQPVTLGIANLVSSKYSTPGPAPSGSGATPGVAVNKNHPTVVPGDPEKQSDVPRFAIYKASVSLKEIYILYSGRNPAVSYLPPEIPYDSVRIDLIPLDEKPLLTDADVETYYDGTLIFKDKSAETFDYFLNQYKSVSPLPLVITVDGKRIAWGTYMHPVSSLSPPQDAFLLSIHLPGEQEGNGCYFTLTTNNADRFGKAESLIRSVFADKDKLAGKSDAPQELLDIAINKQGPGSLSPQDDRFNAPEYLSEIKTVNLNDPDNKEVTLVLPSGWKAAEHEYLLDGAFSFKNPKNAAVKTMKSFDFYIPDTLSDTWSPAGLNTTSGILETRGYYRDQPESSIFNNHSSMVKELYDGETVLGQGRIFLMDNDIARDLQEGGQTTYSSIYVWIPISGEDLAYSMEIYVPANQGYEETYKHVMNMLGIKQ